MTAMLVWTVSNVALLWTDFTEFIYLRFDLGNMTQAVWSTADGRPLDITSATGEQVSRLAFHVDPILVVFAPLWVIAPSPLTLAVVQVAACALGALPVYWLAKRHLDRHRTAALMALVYLMYPWLAWNALNAMHPVTLAIPLLLFAIWALDVGRMYTFAVCAVLAVLCGELVGLVVAGIGLWFWIARNRRGAGLVIAAGGLAWSVLAIKVIVPYFAGGPSVYYAHFAAVGNSPEGFLRTLITDPSTVLDSLSSSRDLKYAASLLAPLAGIPLLAPGLIAAGSAQLLAIGLGDKLSFTDPRSHYTSLVIAMVIAATVFGVARLPSRLQFHGVAVAFALSCVTTVALGPPGGRMGDEYRGLFTPHEFDQRVEALRYATTLVPDGAPVSATSAAGSHLSARQSFYSVPVVADAEWVVIEEKDTRMFDGPYGYFRPREMRRFVEDMRSSERWRLVFERGGILVFRRIESSA